MLEVEVDRTFTSLFGMDVDLPRLAQRIALDEVALVVHVEPVLDRVVLQVGDEAGDVENGHAQASNAFAQGGRDRVAIARLPSVDRPPGSAKNAWIIPS